jgi:lysophospholipase L1-like esterase
METYSYLALGDSYTIGESVPLYESYPYQLVQSLRLAGKAFYAPEIIAKTGWTTSDLASRLKQTILNSNYDFVSLLIGVNNQYRNLSSAEYTLEFEELLLKSIAFANNYNGHVFVLSIPNWGQTPYARGRDTNNISKEIGLFNNINRTVSKNHKVNYVDIAEASPENPNDISFLSGDGLHPSGKSYARWAALISEKMLALTN